MKRTFSRFDIEILAGLVACVARVDTTEPDPNNLRSGWRTDRLLQDIDAFVVGQGNDPASYAQITRQALVLYKASGGNSPEIIALFQLAVFRGERLLPVSAAREQELKQMVFDLGKVVTVLPEGPRQVRCQSLFQYHLGVFCDAYGYFRLAADAQNQAAEQADRLGDLSGAAVCRHLAAVYQLCQALRADQTEDSDQRITDAFSGLEQRFAQMVKATRGTDKQVQWGEGNGPMHMILACIWLDRPHPDWSKWMATALAAAEKLGQAWGPGLQLARAAYLDSDSNQEAEAALQAVADDSQQSNVNRATALLILARRALTRGDRPAVDAAKRLVAQMPKIGAQHVRAIAARLLA